MYRVVFIVNDDRLSSTTIGAVYVGGASSAIQARHSRGVPFCITFQKPIVAIEFRTANYAIHITVYGMLGGTFCEGSV